MRSGPVCLGLAGAHGGDVDRGDDAAQAFGIIAAVEMFFGDVVERHLFGRDQVAQADLVGLEVRFAGDGVEHQFHHETDAGAGDAAIRQDRRLVGGGRPGAATIRLHHVRAGQDGGDLRGFQAGGKRIGRIGAGIDRGLGIHAEQLAIGRGVGGDIVVMLAAVRVAGELFAAVLDPAHRVAEAAGEPAGADLLGQQDALVAEAAADIGRDNADPRLLGRPRQPARPVRTICGSCVEV